MDGYLDHAAVCRLWAAIMRQWMAEQSEILPTGSTWRISSK